MQESQRASPREAPGTHSHQEEEEGESRRGVIPRKTMDWKQTGKRDPKKPFGQCWGDLEALQQD